MMKKVFLGQGCYLIDIFKAYYGGRTEALKRGYFTNVNYYDFNSLYPSVMYEMEYPDPNSKRFTQKNTNKYINEYEGVSEIEIEIPYTKIPVLPYRTDTSKVLFPYGKIKGWYSHIEIREAMKHGAVLLKVYNTHYYTETCRPFKCFVEDMYNKRLEYKSSNNPMQIVVKLLMNSLYGKFGQKFIDKSNCVHVSSVTKKDIDKWKDFDRVGDYFVYKQSSKPSAYCIPIWAVYVTAYGRLKLHKELVKHDVIYCDTDSIITTDKISCSQNLGELKLEMTVSEGIVVRPKFYALKEHKNGQDIPYVKIKGLGKRLNYYEFVGILHMPKIPYEKFAKFKEAIRRDFIPNEIIKVHKEFSLEDEKRLWNGEFDYKRLEESEPIEIDHYDIMKEKSIRKHKHIPYTNGMMSLIGEDTFDHKGNDISKQEFLENEIFFSLEE
jgi:DNA polymerase elongation subunit (family B)